MGLLIARLFQFAKAALSARGVQIGVGAAGIADVLNIDVLRREAVKLAPTSDPEALEEAARQILRMLGIDGSDVRGPKKIEDWNYFHMSMQTGQAWFTRSYISRHSQKALIRAVTRAPSGVVGGGYRSTSGYRGGYKR